MNQPSSTPAIHQQKGFVKTILFAGLIAGTLDIAAAVIIYIIDTGKNPLIIFNFIASGIFGKAAFAGGIAMVVWGFVFHYLIAFLFTIFFFFIYQVLKLLQKNIFITAIIYGAFIWIVMNLVILPLSNTPAQPFNLTKAIKGIAILILCVGLPVSLIANKYFRGKI